MNVFIPNVARSISNYPKKFIFKSFNHLGTWIVYSKRRFKICLYRSGFIRRDDSELPSNVAPWFPLITVSFLVFSWKQTFANTTMRSLRMAHHGIGETCDFKRNKTTCLKPKYSVVFLSSSYRNFQNFDINSLIICICSFGLKLVFKLISRYSAVFTLETLHKFIIKYVPPYDELWKKIPWRNADKRQS